jgi:diguanylate cyclase (GGDEF)-like protein/PAS domain S-box-containing protein
VNGTAPILVVDDNAAKRLSLLSILEPLGHEIVEARSGEEALRAVMERTFAVILMDVHMPQMDGYETARLIRMRDDCEHTPFIFVTAHARGELQGPEAYASGAVDFIFAPIVPDTLRAKVTVFVDLFVKSRELELSLGEVTVLSERFRDSEARTRAVLENVGDGIVTLGAGGTIESFNRAATDLFGYTEAEALGSPFSILFEENYRPLGDVSRAQGAESVGRRQDGTAFPMEVDLSEVQLGTRKIHVACVTDVSERRMHMASLQHAALHDGLTGLPNRVLFGDRVNHAILLAARAKAPLVLLVLDLDGFKQVNDRLGHHHGDLLLNLVADRLLAGLREGDTVARLGGDEFGILPIGGTDLAGAASVAWKVQKALDAPFDIEGHAVEIRASIGITMFPEHGDNIDDLLRRADLAMYDAKRSGGGYAMFAAEQEEIPAKRLALIGDLRQCVERDELVLHYQPKVDLLTGETVGLEALLRWRRPGGLLVSPGEFMPEVERNEELMNSITQWVVSEALGALHAWREMGYDLTMAVNIGALCLVNDAGFFDRIDDLTRFWGVPGDKLTFELTESAFIDLAVPGLFERLAGMDERLSIDDFGTGYSSLVYLQRLPVVEIKADRSFITNLSTVAGDAVIVRSIIDLAHNLGMQVVAEGVEDQPTLDILLEYGCDAAQGYLFSRALPADDLTAWLETSEYGLPRRLNSGPPPGPLSSAALPMLASRAVSATAQAEPVRASCELPQFSLPAGAHSSS